MTVSPAVLWLWLALQGSSPASDTVTVKAERVPMATSPMPLPFVVENPSHKPFPPDLAERIYWVASRKVAEQVNNLHPQDLRPIVTLHLGFKSNQVITTGLVSDIFLDHWDTKAFSVAMVMAAKAALLSPEKEDQLADRVATETAQKIDVRDYQK